MTQQTQQQVPGQGRQIDDNQDEFGRDINNPDNRIGDRATADQTDADAKAERAHEASRKIGLQRDRKREDDQSDEVSGGFNQKQ